jgi:hypothetical protein
LEKSGDELEAHYIHVLRELGAQPGLLGQVSRKAQNKIQDPARRSHLIKNLIDKETWSILDVDVKGHAYEGLLDKGVADGGAGAGQYFTPARSSAPWSRSWRPVRPTPWSTQPAAPIARCRTRNRSDNCLLLSCSVGRSGGRWSAHDAQVWPVVWLSEHVGEVGWGPAQLSGEIGPVESLPFRQRQGFVKKGRQLSRV